MEVVWDKRLQDHSCSTASFAHCQHITRQFYGITQCFRCSVS